jgi:hypothetical protein
MDQVRSSSGLSTHPTMRSRFRRLTGLLLSRTPSGDGHRADPVQKQVPGEWMTQKGID